MQAIEKANYAFDAMTLHPVKQRLIVKITTVLQHVPLVGHLSRQKFIAQFVIGLIKGRNVRFCEVAHLNDAVKPASNETRIQHFFRTSFAP